MLEVEVSFCIAVRDVLDHLMDELHLALRQFALFKVFSEDAAEDAAEILVTRI